MALIQDMIFFHLYIGKYKRQPKSTLQQRDSHATGYVGKSKAGSGWS